MRVLEAEDHAGLVFLLRAEDVFRRAPASAARCCRGSFFITPMLSTVLVKFSHTDTVQLAAVMPPLRMSSNTGFELRDVQPVDDDAVLMQRAHVLLQYCRVGGINRSGSVRTTRRSRGARAVRSLGHLPGSRAAHRTLPGSGGPPREIPRRRSARRAGRRAEADARRRSAGVERMPFLLQVMPARSSAARPARPSGPSDGRSTSSRWLSVPPVTRSTPPAFSTSPSACAFASTLSMWSEVRVQHFAERDGLAGDHVHQRAALQAGNTAELIFFAISSSLVSTKPPRAAQRLVGGRRDDVRMLDRVRVAARGDHAGDVRHVHHQLRADAVGDRTEAREVERTRVGRSRR